MSLEQYGNHTGAVEKVAKAGVEPPAEWTELRGRFDAYFDVETPILDRLISAIITPNANADVPMLRVLAQAEANTHGGSTDVTNALRVAVLYKLRTLYAPQADANYNLLADRFNEHAVKLTKAMSVVSPDTEPQEIINATQSVRTSWAAAQDHSLQLSALLPALKAAAILTGRLPGTADREEFTLPLVADLTGLHRRKVWEAWATTTEGRAGRWGALITLGATVRAVDLDAGLEPYRTPKPMEKKQVHNGQGVRFIDFDPEDQPEEAAVPA